MTTDFNIKQLDPAVSGVVCAHPACVLQNINGQNFEADDSGNPLQAFFQIFDQVAAPAPGDVPVFCWRIPPGGSFNANMPGPSYQQLIGQSFANGISVGWSLTQDSFSAAADGGTWYATGRYV